jgi:hypothetical protein
MDRSLGGVPMFFRKLKSVVCAVCGKPIEAKERRFVVKNRKTKAERHTHVTCQNPTSIK